MDGEIFDFEKSKTSSITLPYHLCSDPPPDAGMLLPFLQFLLKLIKITTALVASTQVRLVCGNRN